MLKKIVTFFMFVASLSVAMQASAVVYEYDIDDPYSFDYGTVGEISNFFTSYNDVDQQLSFSSTITAATAANINVFDNNDPAVNDPSLYVGNLPDNFWLVLSDGPDPKTNQAEYAILYGDAVSGNLTAYVYDTAAFNNGAESWTLGGGFIQSFENAVTLDDSVSGQVTFDFSIDSSFINAWSPVLASGVANDWTGVAFAENIGIWYHPNMFQGAGISYDADGSITNLEVLDGTWYDVGFEATAVPVPAAAWLFGTGLLGLVGVARRK